MKTNRRYPYGGDGARDFRPHAARQSVFPELQRYGGAIAPAASSESVKSAQFRR